MFCNLFTFKNKIGFAFWVLILSLSFPRSPVPDFCFVALPRPHAAHANPLDVKSTILFRSVRVQDHPFSVNLRAQISVEATVF